MAPALRKIAAFLNRLYALSGVLAGGGLVFLLLLVLFSVGARLVGAYGGGATDIAGYVMATATFLALAPTFRGGGHILISVFTARLPPSLKRGCALGAYLIMFFATGYLAFYLTRLAYFSYQFQERSEGADAILLWLPQTPIAFGAILFAVAVAHSGVEAATQTAECNDETP